MTSKLKCPVCNHKLYQTASEPATYCCLYKDCQSDFKFAGSKELWQALIQARQDLEIARKALEYYADSRFGKKQDDGTYALEIDKGCGVTVVYAYDPRSAKQALEQIEHKE